MAAKTVINTAGDCSENPGTGGFAAIIDRDGGWTTVSGGDPETTNNRMELVAPSSRLGDTWNTCPESGEARSRCARIPPAWSTVVNAFNKN